MGIFFVGESEDIIGRCIIELSQLDDYAYGNLAYPTLILRIKRLVAEKILRNFFLGLIAVLAQIANSFKHIITASDDIITCK